MLLVFEIGADVSSSSVPTRDPPPKKSALLPVENTEAPLTSKSLI